VTFFPKERAPRLLIVAHMDTVSARGMRDPFKARKEGGKIYGRGTCDDKGPLAAGLCTLLELFERGELAYDVTFAATVDEECSMSGAAYLAREEDRYDLCVALEPTNLEVINAHKGVYRGEIITWGKSCHSSSPEKGENAILKMHQIISDLESFGAELQEVKDPLLGKATLALTQINGGTVINIIPERCSLSFDIRLLPQQPPREVARKLKKLVGDRGAVRKIFAAKAISSPAADPLIKHFLEAGAHETGKMSPKTAAYATDCSRLIDKGPCVVWGPGDIAQAHQQEEYISIAQIEGACRILKNFLTRTPDSP